MTYYDVVGDEVCNSITLAFSIATFPQQQAKTLIVPIPKVDTTTMNEFRPISLCNVLIKFISKVLVQRLRPHMDSIIGLL